MAVYSKQAFRSTFGVICVGLSMGLHKACQDGTSAEKARPVTGTTPTTSSGTDDKGLVQITNACA